MEKKKWSVAGVVAIIVVTLGTVATALLSLIAGWTVDLPLNFLQAIAATVLPFLVGIVAKYLAPGWWKAALLAVFAIAATAVLDAISGGGTLDVKRFISESLDQFVLSAALYLGLYKPSGLGPAVQQVTATPRVLNLGPGHELPPPAIVTSDDPEDAQDHAGG